MSDAAASRLAIAFVDDDAGLLDGFRRMLRRKREQWDVTFFDQPARFLETLPSRSFDIVVCDMRMPGLNGAAVLHHVHQRAPSTVRIFLSGQMHALGWFRCLGPGHRLLAKPCAYDQLEAGITASWALEQRFRALAAEPAASASRERPPAYDMLRDALIEEAADAELEGIAFEATSSLTPAWRCFGGQKAVSATLGAELAHALAVGLHGLDTMRARCTGVDAEALMEHATRIAARASAIALLERSEGPIVQQTAVAALLHGIGACETPAAALGEPGGALQRARLAARIIRGWGMPDAICEAVAFHRDPATAVSPESRPLVFVHAAVAIESLQRPQHREPLALDRIYLESLSLERRADSWQEPGIFGASGESFASAAGGKG
jgi:response regulator RpfG family c-di-GMP phosphodiesterase